MNDLCKQFTDAASHERKTLFMSYVTFVHNYSVCLFAYLLFINRCHVIGNLQIKLLIAHRCRTFNALFGRESVSK